MILTLPSTAKRIKIIFLLFSFLTFFFYKTQAQQEVILSGVPSYSYGNVDIKAISYPNQQGTKLELFNPANPQQPFIRTKAVLLKGTKSSDLHTMPTAQKVSFLDTNGEDFIDNNGDNIFDDGMSITMTTQMANKSLLYSQLAANTHYSVLKVKEFFFQKLGWHGVDKNNTTPLNVWIVYDDSSVNSSVNPVAFAFKGSNGANLVILRSNPDIHPFHNTYASIDMIGHEYTHNIFQTLNKGSNLEYDAIQEGFSSIMGMAAKHYVYPNSGWKYGDNAIKDFPTRCVADFSDPSNTEHYSGTIRTYPDTYFGFYYDQTGKEIHRNGAVFCYWYYLLSVGGSGTNDLGVAYSVAPIGEDMAAEIVFTTMIYNTHDASYKDLALQTYLYALHKYDEVTADKVREAWKAVGLPIEKNSYVSPFATYYYGQQDVKLWKLTCLDKHYYLLQNTSQIPGIFTTDGSYFTTVSSVWRETNGNNIFEGYNPQTDFLVENLDTSKRVVSFQWISQMAIDKLKSTNPALMNYFENDQYVVNTFDLINKQGLDYPTIPIIGGYPIRYLYERNHGQPIDIEDEALEKAFMQLYGLLLDNEYRKKNNQPEQWVLQEGAGNGKIFANPADPHQIQQPIYYQTGQYYDASNAHSIITHLFYLIAKGKVGTLDDKKEEYKDGVLQNKYVVLGMGVEKTEQLFLQVLEQYVQNPLAIRNFASFKENLLNNVQQLYTYNSLEYMNVKTALWAVGLDNEKLVRELSPLDGTQGVDPWDPNMFSFQQFPGELLEKSQVKIWEAADPTQEVISIAHTAKTIGGKLSNIAGAVLKPQTNYKWKVELTGLDPNVVCGQDAEGNSLCPAYIDVMNASAPVLSFSTGDGSIDLVKPENKAEEVNPWRTDYEFDLFDSWFDVNDPVDLALQNKLATYFVQLSLDPDMKNPVLQLSYQSDELFDKLKDDAVLLCNTTYYWNVTVDNIQLQGINPGTQPDANSVGFSSAPSLTGSFKTALPKSKVLSPVDEQMVPGFGNPIPITWTAYPGTKEYDIYLKYKGDKHWQLLTTLSAASLNQDDHTKELTYDINTPDLPLPAKENGDEATGGDVCLVKVVPIGKTNYAGFNEKGTNDEEGSFTLDPEQTKATLISPKSECVDVLENITLQWESLFQATDYQVRMFNNSDMSFPLLDVTVPATPNSPVQQITIEPELGSFWGIYNGPSTTTKEQPDGTFLVQMYGYWSNTNTPLNASYFTWEVKAIKKSANSSMTSSPSMEGFAVKPFGEIITPADQSIVTMGASSQTIKLMWLANDMVQNYHITVVDQYGQYARRVANNAYLNNYVYSSLNKKDGQVYAIEIEVQDNRQYTVNITYVPYNYCTPAMVSNSFTTTDYDDNEDEPAKNTDPAQEDKKANCITQISWHLYNSSWDDPWSEDETPEAQIVVRPEWSYDASNWYPFTWVGGDHIGESVVLGSYINTMSQIDYFNSPTGVVHFRIVYEDILGPIQNLFLPEIVVANKDDSWKANQYLTGFVSIGSSLYVGSYPCPKKAKGNNSNFIVEHSKDSQNAVIKGVSVLNNKLKISPNPAQNIIRAITGKTLKKATLTIYDMTGKVVITTPYQNNQQVNVSALSNGVYMVILKDGTEQFTDKLIISR